MPTTLTQPRAEKVATHQRTCCSACGCNALEEVLDLPRLPLTGIFVSPQTRADYPEFDQALLRCTACGHGQLRDSVDPIYLYQDTYTHRSSLSPISTRGNDFFHRFIEDVAGDRHFESVAEVGCNDLYLLKKLQSRATHLTGFDPIWKDHQPAEAGEIRVFGKYVEEITAEDLPERPDLVVSVHTLEHVDNPLESLRPIYAHARPGALFMIEIPSLDTLLTINRFDQVFHQHLNYFSLASAQRMVECLGGEYLDHRFNYGYWLGTMMVAFRKPADGAKASTITRAPVASAADIRAQYARYRRQMSDLTAQLRHHLDRGVPAVGFGAAQMVPTLAYHMGTDLSELQAIVDDNPDKNGRTWPSIGTTIASSAEFNDLSGHAVLLTALDSARVLIPHLIQKNARYLLVPNNPF
ncbi:class I SAM-dependent methyltransferase [Actomonas aquatica]|uniref:Class I SAM-dependent methyltransferase n=1 Tax=Actomonas aquatica TaxID=2866162 RepID=A0ABZ1CD51_9BACT|nr:class I SAM-dependent methyltransferase [Opitutus sp. WL0086]WRQ89315.1 class I SAM-dependent methyltransferase [Opitutus sp. WL0086]